MTRALLWKDLRVNLFVLVFGAFMLLGPYLAVAVREIYLRTHGEEGMLWHADAWGAVAILSVGLSLLTLAFLGGVAFAAERQDRSAEFLAYLPCSRAAILTSKLLVALLVIGVIWGGNLLVAYGLAPAFCDTYRDPNFPPSAAPVYHMPKAACVALLAFGAAWFASSFLDSAAIAAGIGIFAPPLLFGALATTWWYLRIETVPIGWWYCGVCAVLGGLGFVSGCVIYLRRVLP
jgi:ABC-type transport system involved in multi-copper enzyme maturation permease subunit